MLPILPYYRYYCSTFCSLVLVYALPSGSFAHVYLQYGFHIVSELPF